MVDLEFIGFLPHEEKPEKFEIFRNIASEIYRNLSGKLVFTWIEAFDLFDITENSTEKNYSELKNMLKDDLNYLL